MPFPCLGIRERRGKLLLFLLFISVEFAALTFRICRLQETPEMASPEMRAAHQTFVYLS